MLVLPVHKSRVVLAALHMVDFDIFNQTPYNPDLNRSDYYLFSKMKKELRSRKLMAEDDVKETVSG